MVMNTVDLGIVGAQSKHRQTVRWPFGAMTKRTLDVEIAGIASSCLVGNELLKQIPPPLHRTTNICESVSADGRECGPVRTNKPKKETRMKRTSKVLIAGAAMAGLMTGSAARVHASLLTASQNGTSISSWGQMDDSGNTGKHNCKGQNSCKGQGGCSAGDNGCSGKNSCKGKGGCNTNK
jgi:hypothetical protein